MRRILFINRFYWPEETATAQLLADLASALAAKSYSVEVLTARTRRDLPKRETYRGVFIRRLGVGHRTRTNLFGKFFDYLRFLGMVFGHLAFRRQDFDTVIAMSDPPFLGATVWLATLFRSVSVVHWIQDIYPEIAVEVGGPRWLNGLRPWRNHAWRRAAGCVVPGATMRDVVASAGVAAERIVVSPNWALPELQPVSIDRVRAARIRLGLSEEFVAAYAGNLGRVHELEPLLTVAEQLRGAPNFVLLFIGQGAQRVRLEKIAADRNLTNVRFIDAQPRSLLAETLSVANVHFVTLKPGAERWVFPSKICGIVAIGRPILFLGAEHSEVGRLITDNGWGRCFSPERIADIAKELRSMHGDEHRRHLFVTENKKRTADDFAVAVAQWMALLGAETATSARLEPASNG